MKFEVIEDVGDWIVRRDGVELGRFSEQEEAFADVAARLATEEPHAELSYSLGVRYLHRA